MFSTWETQFSYEVQTSILLSHYFFVFLIIFFNFVFLKFQRKLSFFNIRYISYSVVCSLILCKIFEKKYKGLTNIFKMRFGKFDFFLFFKIYFNILILLLNILGWTWFSHLVGLKWVHPDSIGLGRLST